MLFESEDDVPVVVSTITALQIVHLVTLSGTATSEDNAMADSLLSAILPELRYPTTALRPEMRHVYNTLGDKYVRTTITGQR